MKLLNQLLSTTLLSMSVAIVSTSAYADTSAFTIVDDPQLDAAVAQVRSDFLATRTFDRLSATILVANEDGTWSRGSYEPDRIEYPASCVKLGYLAAAMYWCQSNGHPYDYLDDSVRPMITVSDNVATGEVVDAITGAPNIKRPKRTDPTFEEWYQLRLFTENYLTGRGLLGNQTILHKTYPSNSGSSPDGYEQDAMDLRGGNRMQPLLSASLMLEVIKGAIEPGANAYMRELLTHNRFSGDSVVGFGMPPGCIYENKLGVAYDTVEDIAYVEMPNGKEFILTVYTNSWDTSEPYPYDAAQPSVFAEMLVEYLGLDAGNPAKIKIDNEDAAVSTTGTWTLGNAQLDKFGPSYLYADGGSGATATYTLNPPADGTYEVVAWWADGSNRASNSPFTINHADGSTTINVDQTQRGGVWVRLGDFNFNAGQGSVVIGTAGVATSSLVVADAIKITQWPAGSSPIDPPEPGTDVIVDNDNGEPYYVETGAWSTSSSNGYNGLTYRFATTGTAADATWTADLTEAGNYEVKVIYRAGTNRATDAQYIVVTNSGTQAVSVDQTVNDSTWVSLGVFPFDVGANSVVLDASASSGGDVVIADAVHFALTSSGPATTTHVNSITLGLQSGTAAQSYGQATVVVFDDLGAAVSGATVTGTFTGDFAETVSAVTDASGTAVLTTTAQTRKPVFGICVDDITHATLTYDSSANVETCDSN